MMADVAEFKAARLRKNREYEGLVKEKEIRGMDKVKWAPNAQNRALDDLLEADKAAPDVPKTPDIGDLTAPSARAGNLRPPSRGASTPGSGSSRPPTGGSSRPNSRGDNARIRELRKASRAANFAATLRAGVDSQGAFRFECPRARGGGGGGGGAAAAAAAAAATTTTLLLLLLLLKVMEVIVVHLWPTAGDLDHALGDF
ncbi:hypothetical protein JL720_8139 [Aureococcus anophagefferens]|nr:hypothetical protein JL720_8139 [Aureococcus anophagefferens]